MTIAGFAVREIHKRRSIGWSRFLRPLEESFAMSGFSRHLFVRADLEEHFVRLRIAVYEMNRNPPRSSLDFMRNPPALPA